MSKNQQTLDGNAVSIQDPSIVDKHRGCVARAGEPNENGVVEPHGVSPYCTAVTDSGVRTPVCKTHARGSWIDSYETG